MSERDAEASRPKEVRRTASATTKSRNQPGKTATGASAEDKPRIKPTKMAMAASAKDRSKWTVEVDVLLESDSEPPKFRVDSFLQPEPGGKLVFKNRGRRGFVIVFHLRDETGRGYHFPKSARDAVWSQIGANACPTSAICEVFKALRVFNEGMSLAVLNRNPSPPQGDFTYTLRVTNGDEWRNLDPAGSNQNGQEY